MKNGVFLCGLLYGAASGSAPAWQLDTDISADYVDNIARAESSRDQFYTSGFGLGMAATHQIALTPSHLFFATASTRAIAFVEIPELSSIELALTGGFRGKLATGYTAPWYELSAEISYVAVRESDIRERARLRTEMQLGKRITDRIALLAGYGFDVERAPHGDVFDTYRQRIFVNLDYALTSKLAVYGTLNWRAGELTSTASPNAKILNASNAKEIDEALSAVAFRRLVAYQLDGDIYQIETGLNYAISRALAVDISSRYFEAYGRGNNDYDGFAANVSLLYRFH